MEEYLRSFSPYGIHFDEVSFKPAQSIGKHIFGNIQKYVCLLPEVLPEHIVDFSYWSVCSKKMNRESILC